MLMSYAESLEWKKLPLEVRRKLRQAEREKTRRKGGTNERDDSARYERERKQRLENVAIFDTETTPFDNTKPDEKILPFLGIIYTAQFPPIIIWEENFTAFVAACMAAFETLPGHWTIYAHNGGRFDWMYFLAEMRGRIVFKGRGLMSARLGRHELRDSFHIIPAKLAAFQKDEFDYQLMGTDKRNHHKQQIIDYCVNDCRYLFRTVIGFLEKFGFVLTIGQAAMRQIKAVYKFDRYSEKLDTNIRRFYHGGRVECLQGAGYFEGDYKLYDLNSAYPDAMAHYEHPHKTDVIDWRFDEEPNEHTFFIRLRCKNRGALITAANYNVTSRKIQDIANSIHPGAEAVEGEFFTTIWEHNAALECGLISDVEYLECIDFPERTNFSQFILPNYAMREPCKALIADYESRFAKAELGSLEDYQLAVRDSLFYKLINNNGYGKFAQNPRDFKESMILPPGEYPEGYQEWLHSDSDDDCEWISDEYWNEEKHLFTVWQRPSPEMRFNNVGIAASITGRVRATLLTAIASAVDPIYVDTDSILCKELKNVELSSSKLGAWNFEGEFDQIIIAGKKTYMARNTKTGKIKSAAKGGFGLNWEDYQSMISGIPVTSTAKGVTIYKSGAQEYLRKTIRQTAPKRRY